MKVILALLALLAVVYGQTYAGTYKSGCYQPPTSSQYVILTLTLGATTYQNEIDAYAAAGCAGSKLATIIVKGAYVYATAQETIASLSSNGTVVVTGVSNMNVTFGTTANTFTVEAFGTGLGAVVTAECNGTGNFFPITVQDNTLTDISQTGCLGLGIPPAFANVGGTNYPSVFYDIFKVSGKTLETGYNANNLYTPTAPRSSTMSTPSLCWSVLLIAPLATQLGL